MVGVAVTHMSEFCVLLRFFTRVIEKDEGGILHFTILYITHSHISMLGAVFDF